MALLLLCTGCGNSGQMAESEKVGVQREGEVDVYKRQVCWGQEKLELDDIKGSRRRFLVRVKGEADQDLSSVEAVFGHVDPITVPELSGEFAFVTGVISEGEYKEKAEKLGTVISRIRRCV